MFKGNEQLKTGRQNIVYDDPKVTFVAEVLTDSVVLPLKYLISAEKTRNYISSLLRQKGVAYASRLALQSAEGDSYIFDGFENTNHQNSSGMFSIEVHKKTGTLKLISNLI